ncbi:hypothetical protein Goarm_018228 [Gossypium armourianum]|uniref:Uncharacterized protein n=1 Tax=Gossypium armourianum TaxID=34283 RepID=A0A7J9IJJ1_9ROSI|nr:hypothetical protein [Gossypium armourianum]
MNRKYLEDPCVWVESNTTTLSILSSHAEIGLGWLLIFSLFSSVADIFFSLFGGNATLYKLSCTGRSVTLLTFHVLPFCLLVILWMAMA